MDRKHSSCQPSFFLYYGSRQAQRKSLEDERATSLQKTPTILKGAYDGSFNGSKSKPAWRNLTPIGEGQQDGKKDLATHLALACQATCLSTNKAAADEKTRYGSGCVVHP
jgi:hypothetical protein